jgi:phage terminase small subunit
MPALKNPKHELFAQALSKGMTLEKAHEDAGYSGNRQAAHKLKCRDDIQARVSELLANKVERERAANTKATEKLAISKEWVLRKLVENIEKASQAVPVNGTEGAEYKYEGSVVNRSLELLGKELGMFVDRKETGAPGEFADINNTRDLERVICERLGLAERGHGSLSGLGRSGSLRSKAH